jgi:hypothetical protein
LDKIEIMKTQTTRNAALALLGLLSLTIYILACTSFSPDDKKVLYPAFEKKSGAIGMAVYDRETRRSEMLFTPICYGGDATNSPAPMLIRGQWLPDGRRIVVAWAGGKNDESLSLALLPLGVTGPSKVFRLPESKDAAMTLRLPPCLAGERVFFMNAPTTVVRVDLQTGAIASHEFTDVKKDFSLFPAPDGTGVLYVQEEDQQFVFGRLDPNTFERTPLLTITNKMADKSFFACDARGRAAAFVEKVEAAGRLVVLRQGKPAFTRPLGVKDEPPDFGSAEFSPKGDLILATFCRPNGTNSASYGLMEIPLSDAPIRETILIPSGPLGDEATALYFQGSISHDGKTAAITSTFLACTKKDFQPGDCALFLVDLNNPDRKVTKITIPLPDDRPIFK